MYPTPNPYFNNPYQNYQQSLNHQQIVKVNGRNGADTFQMAPNSSAMLLDESAPLVWLAQTDGAGYKTLTAYDIQPHQELPPVDTRALEQRITKLEELINESHNTSTKQWKPNYESIKSGSSNGSNAQNSK